MKLVRRRLLSVLGWGISALWLAQGAMAQDNAAAGQHQAIGVKLAPKAAFQRTTHPDAQWFPDAGLGLFVHWGIASVHGKADLSWAMMANVPWDSDPSHFITPREYFALAEGFRPDRYVPEKWLRAAKKAGVQYAVLTTRHHDGFALWPSAYGDFNTKNYMGGRDLVKGFVDACRKNGLKVGFYYSPPDWHYNRDYMTFRYASKPEDPAYGVDHKVVTLPEKPANWDEQYKAYARNQVEELLTRYGKIDVLWFDGGPDVISIERIRELQPGILINNRAHGVGDFLTPEWDLPKNQPQGWWENCASWFNGWGYRRDAEYHTPAWALERLVRVRASGGNLLINWGPQSNGDMPSEYYEGMNALAQWMKRNKESVIGAGPAPSNAHGDVPITTHGKKWYLHLLPEMQGPVAVPGAGEPQQVEMLATGKPVPYAAQGGKLIVNVPLEFRSGLVDVVEVTWD